MANGSLGSAPVGANRFVVLDANGVPAPGAKVYFYASGTSTPQAVYSNTTLTTPRTNPVEADASGVVPPCYLSAAAYRVLITDADGATIYPATDNIYDFGQLYGLSQNSNGDASITRDLSVGRDLAVTRNATVGGTLGVTGATTLAALLNISGASAGQIQFPSTQNASSNANTLDDYREQSWTPVIGGSGGTSGQAYSAQIGWYIKIGRIFIGAFDVRLTTKGTITGTVEIQGLPLAAGNQPGGLCFIPFWTTTTSSFISLGGTITSGGQAITLYGQTAGATSSTTLATADIADTTRLIGAVLYRTAS